MEVSSGLRETAKKGFSENSQGAFCKFPIQIAIDLVSRNDLDAACVACWWLCGILSVFIP